MANTTDTLERIKAHLNYAGDGAGYSRKLISILDGRAVRDRMSLDVEGFVLRNHQSAVKNFFDSAEIRSTYYPEIERLLIEATGATRALAFEHDVRSASAAERSATGARQAVKVVHDDYTEKSAPGRVRLYLPDEADDLLRQRYAVINIWRPLRGPVLDTPLAVCDAQSIAEDDLIPTEDGVKHEVYLFNFNPNHRWYYFSAMTAGEVLLFKCFDSIRDGSARVTAHSAFDLPSTSAESQPRQSIEVRALVFFQRDSTPSPS